MAVAAASPDAAMLGDRDRRDRRATRSQRRVPIEFLKPNPRNPRRLFAEAELDELAASIRERGIIQPILVRTARGALEPTRSSPASGAGARRSAPACTTCRWCCSRSSDREALELAIIENVQRTDLNALEEAIGYQALVGRVQLQPGRHRQDRRQEPQPRHQHAAPVEAARGVQTLIRTGKMSAGHARALLGQPDPEGAGAGDRRARPQCAAGRGDRAGERRRPAARRRRGAKDADTVALEKRLLTIALGLVVTIAHRGDRRRAEDPLQVVGAARRGDPVERE